VLPGAIPSALDPPANPSTARFADVNHDGFPDLIVAGADYSAPPNPFTFPPNTFVMLNDHHGHFSILPGSLPKKPFARTGEPLDMQVTDLNGDGDGGHDIVYTDDSVNFYARRELDAPVSTLYGATGAYPSLGTSDGTQLDGVRSGAYDVVVHDSSPRDGFRLVGPGLLRATSRSFVGRVVWRVQLRPGLTYKYSSVARPRVRASFRVGR